MIIYMRNNFRFASLLLAAVMLFASCDETKPEITDEPDEPSIKDGELVLVTDKQIITSDGKDAATLTASIGDEVLTEGVTLYDGNDEIIELADFKFTTTEVGTYTFWAKYGASISNNVTITSVPTAVPETPADPDPENTSFVRRVLLTKITGAGCVACPNVTQALHHILENHELAPYVVKAEAHTFTNGYDPAQLTGFYSVNSWPTVIVDWAMYFVPTSGVVTQTAIEGMIEDRYNASEAKAGISVNSVCADGAITLKACVKAAEDGKYCVGAWLLEDNIKGTQSGAPTGEGNEFYHEFDDCIRIADSKRAAGAFSGLQLGEIKAGNTAEKMFMWTLKDKWKVENLKLCIFVSTYDDELKNYVVNNVITAPVNGEVKYEYVK